ncbi:MAG: DUF1611 domain-containing protein [Corynebacterium sp.]|uniref:DUF1611 domain-containing protein n=1 Tax=Corynebacterium sp. TaxID=1720 RepID=UPI0026E035A3|nr:DUF1611 domain-containing protein [Corynebacterium sp.]MDO5670024.1 DUF1611 domain-containing protein [Corynebacterium sp.]
MNTLTSLHDLTHQVPAVAELLDTSAPADAACGPLRRLEVPARLQGSYTTRFVDKQLAADPSAFHLVAGAEVSPLPGDVVLARVTEIRNHRRVETPDSRKAILFPGALILLAYGHRYAADQFLAHVPATLDHCHLVAAGGIAGVVTHAHDSVDEPTLIEPLGLLATSEGVVNISQAAPYSNPLDVVARRSRPRVIAVLGTSMNSGKSTVAACLVNGLSADGHRVGAGKITGTGAGNDRMHYHDAGAHAVIDFTDFGYPTTFRLEFADIGALTINMIHALADTGADTVIVEIADGIYQGETARLLRDETFRACVDSVVFAATDALGARAGVTELLDAHLHVTAAAGVMTASPLAAAEAGAVLADVGVPVIGTFDLTDPAVARGLLPQ